MSQDNINEDTMLSLKTTLTSNCTTRSAVIEYINWHGWNLHFDVAFVHSPCTDGWIAAWLLHRTNPQLKFFALEPQGSFSISYENHIRNKDVWVVDQCLDVDSLIHVLSLAAHVYVVDHHPTTRVILTRAREQLMKEKNQIALLKLSSACALDNSLSAAQLVYSLLFAHNQHMSWIVAYCGDADLGRYELPFSTEINAALYDNKYTGDLSLILSDKAANPFKALEELNSYHGEESKLVRVFQLIDEGKCILAKLREESKTMADNHIFTHFKNQNTNVARLNVCYAECQSVRFVRPIVQYLETLSADVLVIAYLDIEQQKVRISFRRTLHAPTLNLGDVASIVFPGGIGGGHPHAAAASIPLLKDQTNDIRKHLQSILIL